MTLTASVGHETAPTDPPPGDGSSRRRPAPRALLMLPAAVALVLGVGAGLDMLGLWVPSPTRRLDDVHGVLLVMGFVGTLIAVERAVALGRPVALLAPASLGVGAMLLLSAGTRDAGAAAIVAGALGLVAVYVPLWRRQRDDAVLVQALGAVLALGGCVLWWGGVPVSDLVAWLAGFVVLTILGERLELARVSMPASAARDLVLLGFGVCLGAVAILLWPRAGAVLLGGVLVAVTWWLLRHDVARRTVRSTGLTRYMAACLLAGQAWLVVAAAVWLLGGDVSSGPAYDVLVHAVFLGFTISMIMAHAPVILPAVTRIALPYHPAMYAPALLLQVSLVLRLWAGDALDLHLARQIGGVGNAIAVLGFLLVAAWSAGRARGRRGRGRSQPVADASIRGRS